MGITHLAPRARHHDGLHGDGAGRVPRLGGALLDVELGQRVAEAGRQLRGHAVRVAVGLALRAATLKSHLCMLCMLTCAVGLPLRRAA